MKDTKGEEPSMQLAWRTETWLSHGARVRGGIKMWCPARSSTDKARLHVILRARCSMCQTFLRGRRRHPQHHSQPSSPHPLPIIPPSSILSPLIRQSQSPAMSSFV